MKFYFTPLQSKHKIKNDISANITKAGCLFFNKWTLLNLGIDPNKKFLIHLYEDASKRTIGFKITDELDLAENKKLKNIRLVTPFKTKQGSIYAQIGIKPFLNLLTNLHLPCNRMVIKEYNDILLGKLHYITIPDMITTE